ncbi:MAG TPA: Lrp/AsnC ligand binding domain-containing protein [Candidatus Acidoferrales bacterium]|nr:Lrp/AsnC ligand binding domain-containing protein [Candidatus Acidoferrales bacterium]
MVESFVLVRVGTSEAMSFTKTVRETLSKTKGVKDVYGVFGRWDFVIKVETKTLEDLGKLVTDCIRGINGVVSTETLIIGF